jgi:hypothetical protein
MKRREFIARNNGRDFPASQVWILPDHLLHLSVCERARKRTAEIAKPRSRRRIGESCIDLLVQFVDDFR